MKQFLKGILSSPCIEICTYKKGDLFCKACGLTRIEKKSWKNMNSISRKEILENCKQRLFIRD